MEEGKEFEGSDYEDENYDGLQEGPEELGKALIKNSAKGNLSEVAFLIKRKANVNYLDRKG